MHKEHALVSVIVRTKDRPGLLKTALRSIALQDYRPIEVVLVNDGGCELDVETVTKILDECTLTYIRLNESVGRAGAGNRGILEARGTYIAFLDDDDEYRPDHLSTLVSALASDTFKIGYADTELVVKSIDAAIGAEIIKERKVFSSFDFSFVDLVASNYIPLLSLLFDGGVIRESGGFDETFVLYEDWDLLLRLGDRYPFLHVPKVTSIYNQWDTSRQIAQHADAHAVLKAYQQIFTKHRQKISPEVILNLSNKQEHLSRELKELIAKYASLEAELGKSYVEISRKDAEIAQLHSDIQRINVELNQRVDELRRRDAERNDIIFELSQKKADIARLMDERTQLIQALNDIQSTLGWKLLKRVRAIRDKMFPRNTSRGQFYQKVMSRLTGSKSHN